MLLDVKNEVAGLTVAAIFESLTPNYAWAQTVPKDDKDLKTGYETVPSPQGNGSIKGYLARPAKGKKFPVVLVIHENRGLNPYIEDVARRLHVDQVTHLVALEAAAKREAKQARHEAAQE